MIEIAIRITDTKTSLTCYSINSLQDLRTVGVKQMITITLSKIFIKFCSDG